MSAHGNEPSQDSVQACSHEWVITTITPPGASCDFKVKCRRCDYVEQYRLRTAEEVTNLFERYNIPIPY